MTSTKNHYPSTPPSPTAHGDYEQENASDLSPISNESNDCDNCNGDKEGATLDLEIISMTASDNDEYEHARGRHEHRKEDKPTRSKKRPREPSVSVDTALSLERNTQKRARKTYENNSDDVMQSAYSVTSASAARNKLNVSRLIEKCPKFTGSNDQGERSVEEYIASARTYLRKFSHLDEESLVDLLRAGLGGKAKDTVRLYASRRGNTVAELFRILEFVFKKDCAPPQPYSTTTSSSAKHTTSSRNASSLPQLKQESNESAAAFAARIQSHVKCWFYETSDGNKSQAHHIYYYYLDKLCLSMFIDGSVPNISSKLRLYAPSTLRRAVRIANEIEQTAKRAKIDERNRHRASQHSASGRMRDSDIKSIWQQMLKEIQISNNNNNSNTGKSDKTSNDTSRQ